MARYLARNGRRARTEFIGRVAQQDVRRALFGACVDTIINDLNVFLHNSK